MKNFRILFLFLLLVSACKKKENPVPAPVINIPSCSSDLDFTTILGTDAACNWIFGDTMDWKYDSLWCSEIKSLFDLSSLSLDSTDTSTVYFGPSACPNPADTSENFLFIVNPGKTCYVQFVLVDSALNKKFSFSYKAYPGMAIHITPINSVPVEHGKYYRMYYTAHAANFLFFYKGHGDIKII